MRVLAVGNMYPPHHLGGYELVWASAMAHLSADGHSVRVLTTDFRTPTAAAETPDVFRQLRWYWRDHAWPRLGWRERIWLEHHNHVVLSRHLREHRPQLVSWWAMGGMSLSLIEHVRRRGLPAVAFVHDDWLDYGPRVDQWIRSFAARPRAAWLAERLTGVPTCVDLERAARYVFVSETVRAHARAEGLVLEDSAIAHSGVGPGFFLEHPEPAWRWRLLYVGRIDARKGVGDAVAALAELPADATLTLVGDGDQRERSRLWELAAELGVRSRIREVGMRTAEELPQIYAGADVLLFPVRWEEPWGLVPLEAMAAGCPVVATGRGGSGDYLGNGENALLVAPAQPSALAAAVRRLAEDPALRTRLRAGGRMTAGRHTQSGFNEAVVQAMTGHLSAAQAASAHST